jgi:beta-aspartyl-peptidase (threonine type)
MNDFVIVIHGGAENKTKQELAPQEKEYRQGLEEALLAGWKILNKGGTALDAVEAAVRSLEDNGLFNAGKGSVLTNDETTQRDASIICGKTLNAGAVACVKNVKNPISLARKIMEESDHVFMSGDGAEEFALQQGLKFEDDEYFITSKQKEEIKQTKAEENQNPIKDTVGAVALDKYGNLAAAVSTGGLTNALTGRTSDSAMIGAGSYANNDTCAVSCTGEGEGAIRSVLAHEVHAMIKYKNASLREASNHATTIYRDRIEGDRNLIAVTNKGDLIMDFETNLMFRAFKKGNEPHQVLVWREEATECDNIRPNTTM